MKIAIIVDGDAEVASLGYLYSRFATHHTLLKPTKVYANIDASAARLQRALKTPLTIARERGADSVVVILDREQRQQCPGKLGVELEGLLNGERLLHPFKWIRVVLKDRMYENWLIADTKAIQALNKRFSMSDNLAGEIERRGADAFDALSILKTVATRRDYSKVADAVKIMQVADPTRMDSSRSFRRFLHVIHSEPYRHQSKVRA